MTQRRVFIAKAAGATAVVTLALLAFLLAADPSSLRAASAPTLREGRHEGADFLIGMPAQWNGGLVMFAHGYEGESSGRGGRAGRPVRRLPHDARLRLGCLRVPQHGLPTRLVHGRHARAA